ncbi:hypothetical protein ACFTSE_08445 [Bacillus cereus]|uniref:hypothetical protein n=1 Tax=Bacillus cereus TaxID=1396 RepID=UPI0036358813
MSKKTPKVISGQIDIFDDTRSSDETVSNTESRADTEVSTEASVEINRGESNEAEASFEVSTEPTQRRQNRQPRVTLNFDSVIEKLKEHLNFVEGSSFSWDNVISVLVIKLTETDSLNKTRSSSNATHIELTAPSSTPAGHSKTDDFFPTLVWNEVFQQRRLSVRARINKGNIQALKGIDVTEGDQWLPDKIETRRRRNLNASVGRSGNSCLHLGYGQDFKIVREELWPGDYLIFVKQKKQNVFEIFGLKANQFTQDDSKILYTFPGRIDDPTVFVYENIQADSNCYLRVFNEGLDESNKFFTTNENDQPYEVGDEILVFNSLSNTVTHRIEISEIQEPTKKAYFRIKDVSDEPITLEDLQGLGLSEDLKQTIIHLSTTGRHLTEGNDTTEADLEGENQAVTE